MDSLALSDSAADLLEDTWSRRDRSVRGRELRVELVVCVVFLAALGGLVALAPPSAAPHPAAIALVLAYAFAARIEFPIGAGIVVPTQICLIPMFVVAPASLVPGLVIAGLLTGVLFAAALGRGRLDRSVFCAGDAMHALGPALVLVAFAHGELLDAGVGVLALAFAAQLAFDFASSMVHDLLVFGVRPAVHLQVLVRVWAVDAALAPIGLLAAEVAQRNAWAALAPLPALGLLTTMAAERSTRIAKAHDRLRALEHERVRLREVVQRLGDAFASNLDLDALLEIVTRAAMEAVDGDGACARFPKNSRPPLYVGAAMDCEDGAPEDHALTGSIGPADEPIAVVTVARRREFSAEERQTFDHLCRQATVSAQNAIRHERLQAGEARLRQQVYRDPLTGLANRAQLAQRVAEAEARVANDGGQAALLFIDLDGFKVVNDSFGHDAGDELLVAIAGRVRRTLRDVDVAARVGGDEFAVLLNELDRREQAFAVAERLVRHISAAVHVRGTDFVVRASIGLASVEPGLCHEAILHRADVAMYAAKRDGGDRVATFQPDMLARAATRAQLAQDLREAPDREELELLFQPIYDLRDATIPTVEALLRWRHPTRGLLTPGEFIALAEETGSIEELGRFVLEEACRTAAGWPEGDRAVGVSVNVSAAQVSDGRFADDVRATLARHALPPVRLVLEVTESVLVEPDAQTLANLQELREAGVTLALDDFGTGYSALSYLTHFPVDVLKLDRSFLADLHESPAQVRLVAGIVGLAHSLGTSVVAEGIERDDQLDLMRHLGVDLGQGHLLGRPEAAETLARRLAESRVRLVH